MIRWDQKMKFDIRPGDLFDWVYLQNNEPVYYNEKLFSTAMKCWVPIGGPEPMLCIGITDEMIVWVSAKGLFHARVDDTSPSRTNWRAGSVIPRARG